MKKKSDVNLAVWKKIMTTLIQSMTLVCPLVAETLGKSTKYDF